MKNILIFALVAGIAGAIGIYLVATNNNLLDDTDSDLQTLDY